MAYVDLADPMVGTVPMIVKDPADSDSGNPVIGNPVRVKEVWAFGFPEPVADIYLSADTEMIAGAY